MRFKAVIFDLDGTLLDTLEDIGESVNQALVEHGFPENPIVNYKKYVGNGAKNLIIRATHEKANDVEVEKILKRYREIYNQRFFLKTRIYDGIKELLVWLNEVNIPYAVLSNKKHELTNSVIGHYFADMNFSIVCGHKSSVPLKPDPTQALYIVSKLNCKAEDVVFIGDTDVDVLTAKNAGIFAVGALWGFRDEFELCKNGADAIVKTPNDVRAIISGSINETDCTI